MNEACFQQKSLDPIPWIIWDEVSFLIAPPPPHQPTKDKHNLGYIMTFGPWEKTWPYESTKLHKIAQNTNTLLALFFMHKSNLNFTPSMASFSTFWK